MTEIIPTPPPIWRVSPSQIATWLECQRKWAWRHIAKVVLPPHKSAALGIDTHSQLESYLGGGEFDFTKPSAYIAASAVHLLPEPGTGGLFLEHHFQFTSASGIVYHGYMDVVGPDGSVFPGIPSALSQGFLNPRPVVSDHKTTSNFAYAKTPENLKTDPQGVIYSKAVFEMYPAALHADLVWTYMCTKSARKAKRVHLPVCREDVELEFSKIDLVAQEIVTTHSAQPDPLSLPPSPGACGGYGGCPFRHLCTDLSVLNPQGKTMPADVEAMLNDLQSKIPASEQSGLPTWATAPVDPLKQGKVSAPPADLLQSLMSTPAPVALINPPGEEQPLSDLNLKPEPEAETATKKPRAPRRTRAQMEEARAKVDHVPTEPEVKSAPAPVPVPAVPSQGYTLYIDAYPGDEPYTRADTLFAKVAKRIKDESGFDDYRLIEYKGAGIFAGLMLESIKEVTGNLVVDSHTSEGALCLTLLTNNANRVAARGIR